MPARQIVNVVRQRGGQMKMIDDRIIEPHPANIHLYSHPYLKMKTQRRKVNGYLKNGG